MGCGTAWTAASGTLESVECHRQCRILIVLPHNEESNPVQICPKAVGGALSDPEVAE